MARTAVHWPTFPNRRQPFRAGIEAVRRQTHGGIGMSKLTSDQRETRATLLAARAFNRRTMLKGAAAAAVVLGSPMIVKDAFSSSGEVNFMGWAGYDFKAAFDAFN